MHEGRSLYDVVHRLIWQAVHQINIDLVYIDLAQEIDGLSNGRKRLDAPDRLLHVRGKILHAETRACNANIRKSGGELFRDIARIKLERMLTQGRKIEANVELRD